MTLNEAIEHAEHVAASCDGECSEDHWQLADWLRELRRARMELDLLRTLREEFRADAQRYKAENDRLRELVSLMDKRDVLLPCMFGCNANCRFYGGDTCKRIGSLMRELGIEVE